MAYRKLGRTNKHRRAMLANLTRDVMHLLSYITIKKLYQKYLTHLLNVMKIEMVDTLEF